MVPDFELVDTHAHLYVPEFDADRQSVISVSRNAGVRRIYLPNIDTSSIQAMLSLEEAHPDMCHAMMGLHPCSVGQDHARSMTIIEQWLERRRFVAIGEIGTDLYWDKTHIDAQIRCFNRQLELAKDMTLPVAIHSRESLDLNIRLVQEAQDGRLSGVFHCFTGTTKQAQEILDLGFFLGIGGVVTFKNSGLADVLKDIPLQSLVLETDAPYLTPHPFRGKRNEPGYLKLVVDKLAESKQLPQSEIASATTANANLLFKYNPV